jgi:hypothetical protein
VCHRPQVGGTVSAKPIVMRAEYAFCPNLTIIDTPGFIMKVQVAEQNQDYTSVPNYAFRNPASSVLILAALVLGPKPSIVLLQCPRSLMLSFDPMKVHHWTLGTISAAACRCHRPGKVKRIAHLTISWTW